MNPSWGEIVEFVELSCRSCNVLCIVCNELCNYRSPSRLRIFMQSYIFIEIKETRPE